MDMPSKLKIPKAITHRGASGSAPENTLAAIAHAGELGSPAVEFDITISSDGVGVIHHDAGYKLLAFTVDDPEIILPIAQEVAPE